MKNYTLLIAFSFFFGISFSQNWAPIGSQWHFSEQFFWGYPISEDYIMIESVKDTVFNGKSCTKLVKRHNPDCGGRPDFEYMYSENNKVFFWDFDLDKYQVLYDFDMITGDSLIIEIFDENNDVDTIVVYVDSTAQTEINGIVKKLQFVTYSFIFDDFTPGEYNSVITESIGDNMYMFNFVPEFLQACDGNFSTGLRCYYDETVGLFDTGIAPYCTYIEYVSVDNIPKEQFVSIFPIPSNGKINIDSKLDSDLNYHIMDLSGKIISSGLIENNEIILTDRASGILLVEIFNKEKTKLFRSKIVAPVN